jgi:hypothetical protein
MASALLRAPLELFAEALFDRLGHLVAEDRHHGVRCEWTQALDRVADIRPLVL